MSRCASTLVLSLKKQKRYIFSILCQRSFVQFLFFVNWISKPRFPYWLVAYVHGSVALIVVSFFKIIFYFIITQE